MSSASLPCCLSNSPSLTFHVCFCLPRSVQLLTPLLTPQMLAHPAWRCWCLICKVFLLAFQHDISLEDLKLLDDTIVEHSIAFDRVTQYAGLKRPKHHFLTHLATDIWNYGPCRGYWCFGFEGFNKVLKRGAKGTNFINEVEGVMKYWSILSAREMVTRRRSVSRV